MTWWPSITMTTCSLFVRYEILRFCWFMRAFLALEIAKITFYALSEHFLPLQEFSLVGERQILLRIAQLRPAQTLPIPPDAICIDRVRSFILVLSTALPPWALKFTKCLRLGQELLKFLDPPHSKL